MSTTRQSPPRFRPNRHGGARVAPSVGSQIDETCVENSKTLLCRTALFTQHFAMRAHDTAHVSKTPINQVLACSKGRHAYRAITIHHPKAPPTPRRGVRESRHHPLAGTSYGAGRCYPPAPPGLRRSASPSDHMRNCPGALRRCLITRFPSTRPQVRPLLSCGVRPGNGKALKA